MEEINNLDYYIDGLFNLKGGSTEPSLVRKNARANIKNNNQTSTISKKIRNFVSEKTNNFINKKKTDIKNIPKNLKNSTKDLFDNIGKKTNTKSITKKLLGLFSTYYGLIYYILLSYILFKISVYVYKLYKEYPRGFTLSKTIDISHKYEKSTGLDQELAELLAKNITNFILYPSNIRNIINEALTNNIHSSNNREINNIKDNLIDNVINNYIQPEYLEFCEILLSFYNNREKILNLDQINKQIDINNSTLFKNKNATELINDIKNNNIKKNYYLLHFYKNIINDNSTFKINLNNKIIDDPSVNVFYNKIVENKDVSYINCQNGNAPSIAYLNQSINYDDLNSVFNEILMGSEEIRDTEGNNTENNIKKYTLLFYRAVLYKIIYENKNIIKNILINFNESNPLSFIYNEPNENNSSNKTNKFYSENSPYNLYKPFLHLLTNTESNNIIPFNQLYKTEIINVINTNRSNSIILHDIHNSSSSDDQFSYDKIQEFILNEIDTNFKSNINSKILNLELNNYNNLIEYLNDLSNEIKNNFKVDIVIDNFLNNTPYKNYETKLKRCGNFKKLYNILTNPSDTTIGNQTDKNNILYLFLNINQSDINNSNIIISFEILVNKLLNSINNSPKNKDFLTKKVLLTSIIFKFNYLLSFINDNYSSLYNLDLFDKDNATRLNQVFIKIYSCFYKILKFKYNNINIFNENNNISIVNQKNFIFDSLKTTITYTQYFKNYNTINTFYFLNHILTQDNIKTIIEYYMSFTELQLASNYIQDTIEYRKKHLGVNFNEVMNTITEPFFEYIKDKWKYVDVKYSIKSGLLLSKNVMKLLKRLSKMENFQANEENEEKEEKEEIREKFIGGIFKKLFKPIKDIARFFKDAFKLLELFIKFLKNPPKNFIKLLMAIFVLVLSFPAGLVILLLFIAVLRGNGSKFTSFLIISFVVTLYGYSPQISVMDVFGILFIWLGAVFYCTMYTFTLLFAIILIGFILSILYIFDQGTANKAGQFIYKRFVACENDPHAWYKNSRHELNNFNEKSLMCQLNCGSNYTISQNKKHCNLTPNYLPYYCPQPYIFRNYREMSTKGTTTFLLNNFTPGYFTNQNEDKDLELEYLDNIEKYMISCKNLNSDKSIQHDIIAKNICAINVDQKNNDISDKINNMCHSMYCNNGKYEEFCYAYDTIDNTNQIVQKSKSIGNRMLSISKKKTFYIIIIIILIINFYKTLFNVKLRNSFKNNSLFKTPSK